MKIYARFLRSIPSFVGWSRHIAGSIQGEVIWWYADFAFCQITVRDGKGAKDRVTMLPAKLEPALRSHLGELGFIGFWISEIQP